MDSFFDGLLKYSRADDRRRWKKNPSAFAEWASSQATRGWSFLLPKEQAERDAATARHHATKEAVRVAGLAWIQARL